MIKKIEFSAKNLTSHAGLFLLLEHTKKNGIFNLIDHDLVFENASTNKNKEPFQEHALRKLHWD